MTTTNSQTIVPSNTTNSVTTDFVFGTTKNDDNIGVVILKAASDGLGNPLDKSDVNVLLTWYAMVPPTVLHTQQAKPPKASLTLTPSPISARVMAPVLNTTEE